MNPTSEIEESPGVVSSMRVLVRYGRRLSVFMVLAGLALALVMVILNRGYELAAVPAILVGGGAVTPTGLGVAKSWQAQAENRGGPPSPPPGA